jgi:hypothetical protein
MFSRDYLMRLADKRYDASQRRYCLHRWAADAGIGPMTFVLETEALISTLETADVPRSR